MKADATAARCYAALLRLYPRSFRDAYRADMAQLFRDQCADEPLWRVGARASLDLALTLPAQHLEARMNSTSTPLVLTTLAVGGVFLAVVGGSDPTSLILGACLAVAAGTLAVVTWRRAAPVQPTAVTRTWWMLLVGGMALIALVVVGSGLDVDAWYLGFATVLTGIMSMVAGLALGALRIATRHRHAT